MMSLLCTVCLACDSERVQVVKELLNGRHQVLRCSECRLEFVSPIPTDPMSEKPIKSTVTAQGYIEAMKSDFGVAERLVQARARNRIDLYTRLLGGRQPSRILEVGSGTGWMVRALNSFGVETSGVEVDEDLVACAHALGANVRQADICEVDVSTFDGYDVVCASQVLEHILTPHRAVWNMVHMLNPGGIVPIDVPNADSWGARARRLRHGEANWGVISLPHHQVGYYQESLRRLLLRSGLEILRVTERPTNDPVFGQTILPKAFWSKLAIELSALFGHGYLLVGIARKPMV